MMSSIVPIVASEKGPRLSGVHRQGCIVVLDFGGQYAHLLARRVRECGAFSVILPPQTPIEDLRGVAGIILSGGPQSVYDLAGPQANPALFALGVPILGICYGHQWIAQTLRGRVQSGKTKEYGSTSLTTSGQVVLFKGLPEILTVWMSHGDTVTELPPGFRCIASSMDCAIAAMADEQRQIFGVQFHPEVIHTKHGREILQNFVHLCDHAPWSPANFLEIIEERVRREVGSRSVFMLVSGGVDSTVAFTLLTRVLGADRVQGLLIDTGFMRRGETSEVEGVLKLCGFDNLHVADASAYFFQQLEGVCDPEEKRRIIGKAFLHVYTTLAKQYQFDSDTWLLGQGTIYPDTIETGGTKHADTIKTHHNRIDALQKMVSEGRVIEPLRDLYKDEVRELGELLGLPRALVWRQPFPGPGLAVRTLCISRTDCHEQSFSPFSLAVPHSVLPVRSVGVQGDSRTYRHAIILFSEGCYPSDIHWRLANEIPNRHSAFNRVLMAVSSPSVAQYACTPMSLHPLRVQLLRDADAIVMEEVLSAGLLEKIWQFPVVLLPVGIRPSGQSIVLRPVTSAEAMTADVYRLPQEIITRVTCRLLGLSGIDAVFYDLTSKPPATIEWE